MYRHQIVLNTFLIITYVIYTRPYVVSHCTACKYQKAGSGQAAASPPPVNPNGFRRPGCAGVRRSNFRSGQVQYKMGFDFHC
jgi:hypothetical protein